MNDPVWVRYSPSIQLAVAKAGKERVLLLFIQQETWGQGIQVIRKEGRRASLDKADRDPAGTQKYCALSHWQCSVVCVEQF